MFAHRPWEDAKASEEIHLELHIRTHISSCGNMAPSDYSKLLNVFLLVSLKVFIWALSVVHGFLFTASELQIGSQLLTICAWVYSIYSDTIINTFKKIL